MINKKIILIVSMAACYQSAYAEEFNMGREKLTTEQVINILSKEVNNNNTAIDSDYEGDINDQGNSRMIDMQALRPTAGKLKAQPVAKAVRRPVAEARKAPNHTALSLEVLFAYKSSDLTAAARDQLQPVGAALASDRLQSLNFIVEGHTDAIGGYAYNQVLSQERAESVKNYFVQNYRVMPDRIKTLGKGKSELLDSQNPDSAVNRRVRIVALKP